MSHPAPPGARTAAVGDQLSAALAAAGITVASAAAAINTDAAELEDAIAGVAPLYIEDLVTLAEHIGVPAVSLLTA